MAASTAASTAGSTERARHRVVIVGGGFGGLNAAKALARADADVTLLDRTNHHLFQPLLYQVAAGILPPGLIAPAIRAVLRKQANVEVALADVRDIDLDRRFVTAQTPGHEVFDFPYDTLIVAAGATHSYFGRDEFAEFAPGMKTVEDARYLRDSILSKFEAAEMTADPEARGELLTFVVIGAGPTGVELAGQIAELAHQVLPKDFRHIDTTSARIVLVEGAPAVLPPFDPKLQQYTHRVLERMGVEVRTGTLATGMDHDSITVKGPDGVETIPARTRIWAAGVQASPLARLLSEKAGVETDRPGRVVVGPDCSVPGRPEVFVIGDMANVGGLPGVAQPAIQEGKYVGKLVRERLAGRTGDVKPFTYFDKGSMATIGHKYAVAHAFGRRFTGLIAYLMWAFVHVRFLIGWGNRLGTVYTWARALYLSKNRGHRIITFEQAGHGLDQDRPGDAPTAPEPAEPPPLAPRAQEHG